MGRPYGWIRGAHEGGGGHPQGVPLRLDEGVRGAPRGGGHPQGVPVRMEGVTARGEGAHEGCPYGWILRACKGCPCEWIWGGHEGEGTHKGCPYGWLRRARRGGARTVGY